MLFPISCRDLRAMVGGTVDWERQASAVLGMTIWCSRSDSAGILFKEQISASISQMIILDALSEVVVKEVGD